MRKKVLKTLAMISEKHPAKLLIAALVITIIAAAFSETLKLEMQFKNLMPQSHPMVKEFNDVIEHFSSATMIIVAAKGKESELKMFADELAPKLKAMTKYVQRVDYKLQKDFYLNHGFMLQKVKDLKNGMDIYKDLSLVPFLTHLNNNFEKTYVYDGESISTKEKENNAVMFLDAVNELLFTMGEYAGEGITDSITAQKAAVQFLIGDEYFISQDKDMILMMARPTFSLNEVDKVVDAENKIDSLIFSLAEKYPGISAGTTGTMALSRDEMVAASEDMYITSLIAFALIIALFILSFRMWVAPILSGITLILGVIWTAGFAALTVGSLNMMTSMFAVILMGLGIDFSIHIITVYTECRATGLSIGDALYDTLNKSGKGIITGAVTTALAFLTLMVSESAGMKEFGLIAGSGVLFCMFATLLVLPSLLSLRDKLLVKLQKDKYQAKSTEFKFIGNLSGQIAGKPIFSLIVAGIITIIFLISALEITFDYNYLNMEPIGLTSIKLQHEMEEKFDVTPDFAIVTANNVEEARRISEEAKKLKMVGMVTSISEYLPSVEEQNERTPYIKEIKSFLENNKKISKLNSNDLELLTEELYRIESNIIELSQLAYLGGQDKVDQKCKTIIGDVSDPNIITNIEKLVKKIKENPEKAVQGLNNFTAGFEPYFRTKAIAMANLNPITLQTLPENIYSQFANEDGSRFLVSVYPKEGVWENLEFLENFTQRMLKIDERMTGMPSIFYVLIDIIARDGEIAFALTFVVIFLLLLWDFRKVKYAIFATIPLVTGAIWMLGIMHLFGLQITLVNAMGLPLILGIGIDDGVHLLHRYDIEGRGKIKQVFTSTGKAVLLTSITTMLAFGSLVFATYRGLGSMGIALFIGVGACFLTSVTILPALLAITGKNNNNKK